MVYLRCSKGTGKRGKKMMNAYTLNQIVSNSNEMPLWVIIALSALVVGTIAYCVYVIIKG